MTDEELKNFLCQMSDKERRLILNEARQTIQAESIIHGFRYLSGDKNKHHLHDLIHHAACDFGWFATEILHNFPLKRVDEDHEANN